MTNYVELMTNYVELITGYAGLNYLYLLYVQFNSIEAFVFN